MLLDLNCTSLWKMRKELHVWLLRFYRSGLQSVKNGEMTEEDEQKNWDKIMF